MRSHEKHDVIRVMAGKVGCWFYVYMCYRGRVGLVFLNDFIEFLTVDCLFFLL